MIVMIFSATNVAGRLFGGHVTDEKEPPSFGSGLALLRIVL
jgi:hypothetical protein